MLIGLPEMTQEMENLVTPETPVAEQVPAPETAIAEATPAAPSADPLEPLRAKMRAKEHVQARVVRWQRNGLDVTLEAGEGMSTVPAFMPNDNIDRDPNRNVANYFGKTVPVIITNVRDEKITV